VEEANKQEKANAIKGQQGIFISLATPSPKAVAQAPSVSSTAVPSSDRRPSNNSAPSIPAAATTEDPPEDPPIYADLSRVLIQGIEKKPELNGQVGLIITYDGGVDRRYTVRVLGMNVRLREDKLSVVPHDYEAPLNKSQGGNNGAGEEVRRVSNNSGDSVDRAIAAVSSLVCMQGSETTPTTSVTPAHCATEQAMEEARLRDDAISETIRRMPQGEVTASGKLIATYEWVQVPPVASLPPGMEVWMPVGGLKCARIPSTWRLQVVTADQVDSHRCDVGEHTPVIEVINKVAAAFGWQVDELELLGEGKPLQLQDEATVGSAGLFGRKLTARNQPA